MFVILLVLLRYCMVMIVLKFGLFLNVVIFLVFIGLFWRLSECIEVFERCLKYDGLVVYRYCFVVMW